jgi:uncharacterized protein involved in exopolysaccharide biosynthesis
MNEENVVTNDEINLFDLWQVLVKRKRMIVVLVVMTAVASLIVSLLLPKIYAATTSVLPPQQDTLGMSMGLSQGGGAAAGLGGLAGGLLGMKTPTDLWVGILKSNSIRDAIIARFDLKQVFDAKTIEDARLQLARRVKVVKAKEDILSITVEDKRPEMAAQMANAFVEELDKINRGNVMTSGKRTRLFLEKRLRESKEEVTKAELAMKVFQEDSKAVKLDDQSRAIIGAIGQVRGELMAKEVELQTMLSFATPTHPQVQLLQAEVTGLKGQMREMAEGKKSQSSSVPKDIFIPTEKMPDLGLQYARLFRDAKIQETLYGLLTQQYEMARIQEAKDSPTVQVLDIAKAPEKKTRPKKSLIVILSTMTAFFFSVFLAFFLEFLEKNKMRAVGVSSS